MAGDANDRAGEATEEPTPRRLAEARRRGDVAVSRALTSSVALAVAVVVLASGAPTAVARLIDWLRASLGAAVTGGAPAAALASGSDMGLRLLGPPLAALVLVGVGAGVAQTRGLVFAPPRVDLGRLASGGWRRFLDRRAAAAAAQALAEVVVLATVAWLTLRPLVGAVIGLQGAPPRRLLAFLGVTTQRLAVRLALTALAFGVVDYVFVARRHQQHLRMTREEVKRDRRESEGEPTRRGERQRLHRQLAEQRTLEDVRRADLVIVAPELHAVALRYDPLVDTAPVVVAAGTRLVAARIRQLAREAGVPIVFDGPLAGALAALGEGAEIPATLYEAVAELFRAGGSARAIARGAADEPV